MRTVPPLQPSPASGVPDRHPRGRHRTQRDGSAAAGTIDLSAAYFIPDNVAVNSLVAALARGVRVRIIVPGPHMDRALVRRASRGGRGKLLAAGAEIYEYQPTMYHCKVMVVDGLWVTAGSTNFDSRSFAELG